MNKYANTDKDIHIRIHKFVVSCFINVVRKIPKNTENIPIIQQISASLTSIGANDQEADAADSNRDFIAKYTNCQERNQRDKILVNNYRRYRNFGSKDSWTLYKRITRNPIYC
jgi:hypothetical protein